MWSPEKHNRNLSLDEENTMMATKERGVGKWRKKKKPTATKASILRQWEHIQNSGHTQVGPSSDFSRGSSLILCTCMQPHVGPVACPRLAEPSRLTQKGKTVGTAPGKEARECRCPFPKFHYFSSINTFQIFVFL